MNLPLGSPALSRRLDTINRDTEALERQLAMEAEVRLMRENNEAIVKRYIENFWLREKR